MPKDGFGDSGKSGTCLAQEGGDYIQLSRKLILNACLNGSYTTHQNSSRLFGAEGSIASAEMGEIIGYALLSKTTFSGMMRRSLYSTRPTVNEAAR